MTRSEARSPGSEALEKHLKDTGQSISAFAKAKGLDRVQVQRVVNGTRGQRMSVKLAAQIEAATDGAVPMSIWAEDIETDCASSPVAAPGKGEQGAA